MPNPLPVSAPAGFAPLAAIGFTQADATLSPVSATSPLPVAVRAEVAPPALTGNCDVATTVGPYAPLPGRPVLLSLTGNWTGTVRLLRSVDGGATQLPLTVGGQPWGCFNVNCCEAVWEEGSAGAELYLNAALTSGALSYRIEQ